MNSRNKVAEPQIVNRQEAALRISVFEVCSTLNNPGSTIYELQDPQNAPFETEIYLALRLFM
jgi:hypothetical protein